MCSMVELVTIYMWVAGEDEVEDDGWQGRLGKLALGAWRLAFGASKLFGVGETSRGLFLFSSSPTFKITSNCPPATSCSDTSPNHLINLTQNRQNVRNAFFETCSSYLLTFTRLIPKADRKKIHEYLFRGMHIYKLNIE